MDFDEILFYIVYGVIIILVFSGGWILLDWGFNIAEMDNPPTLIETAQNS